MALAAFILFPFVETAFSILPSEGIGGAWKHFLSLHFFLFGATLIPLTIGLSVLRYRLWNMDVLLNRTLVYGGVTAVILTTYVLLVGGISAFFQTNVNLLTAALATGIAALLAHPLRLRLQQLVNQLMYGQRDDPFAVMAELGKQLAHTAVPGEILPALVETIAQTLKLPYVAIVIEQDQVIASVGKQDANASQAFPLLYQSQTIGQLLVAPCEAEETFSPDEERLLRNVARQAGTAVYVAQLTGQLQRSREQLVTTREEERRRLRRDLHDGLGPQLATLTIKVNAVQNLLRKDPDAAEQLLHEVKAESQSAIKEIRRVVQGLRLSVLDQLGLLSALREFAVQKGDGRTQITLQAPNILPPLPAAVEVAAYRIATEAITNTVRHAQAQKCSLHLDVNETLHLEIRDDGRGLPFDYEPGVGLSSMRERALELGGTFAVHSDAGQGTMITVRLPLSRSE